MRYHELNEVQWADLTIEEPVCWFSGLKLYLPKNITPKVDWQRHFTPTVEHLVSQYYQKPNSIFAYRDKFVIAGRYINTLMGHSPCFLKLEYRGLLQSQYKNQEYPNTKDYNIVGNIFQNLLGKYHLERSDLSGDWWLNPKLRPYIELEKKTIELLK